MQIVNGTEMFTQFVHPPVTPYLRIYFFNVTNKEEFLLGSKPILQEVGPYSYRCVASDSGRVDISLRAKACFSA